MNKMTMMGVWLIALFSTGCNQDLVEYNSNDLKISIEKGEEWLHKFLSFWGSTKESATNRYLDGRHEGTLSVHCVCDIKSLSILAVLRWQPKRGAAPLVLSEE